LAALGIAQASLALPSFAQNLHKIWNLFDIWFLLFGFYCNFRGIFYQLHIKMINRDVLKLLYAIVRLLCKGCKPEISEIGILSQVLLSKPLQADCKLGIIFLSKAFSLYFYRDTIYLGRCPKLGYLSLSGFNTNLNPFVFPIFHQ